MLGAVGLMLATDWAHGRMGMFAAGMLLVEAMPALGALARRGPWLDVAAGAAVLLCGTLLLAGPGGQASFLGLFLAGFLLPAAAFAGSGPVARGLAWQPLRWLGNMSYSYYLAHGLVLDMVLRALRLTAPGIAGLGTPPGGCCWCRPSWRRWWGRPRCSWRWSGPSRSCRPGRRGRRRRRRGWWRRSRAQAAPPLRGRHAACLGSAKHQPGTSPMTLSRRAMLGATGLATLPGLPAPWAIGPAAAQSERVLRYGISMADIPQTTGQPDRGAGAYQFTGYTLYDPLVAWEMDVADRPGKLVPGLATSWEADPADRRKWVFKLRPGVKFHDGSDFDAEAVVWNFDKVLNPQAPHFDNRQAAQVRPRLPSVAAWRKLDAMTVEVTTKAVDSIFPYQMLWFLISSPGAVRQAGQ